MRNDESAVPCKGGWEEILEKREFIVPSRTEKISWSYSFCQVTHVHITSRCIFWSNKDRLFFCAVVVKTILNNESLLCDFWTFVKLCLKLFLSCFFQAAKSCLKRHIQTNLLRLWRYQYQRPVRAWRLFIFVSFSLNFSYFVGKSKFILILSSCILDSNTTLQKGHFWSHLKWAVFLCLTMPVIDNM